MPHSGPHFSTFWRVLMPKRWILGPPWRPAGHQMAPKIAQVVQNGRQRFIENLITIIQKSIGNHEKSIPNRPKWCPETIQKQSRQQVDSRNGPRRHRPLFPGPILRHWGDLGRHLGTQLGAKGVPKSSILASRRAKMSKNEVQNETSKKV